MSDGSSPPVLIGEKVWWLGSGSGLPKRGVVRWIGRLPEIGPDWSLGIELEEGLPYGGVDGTWRGRQLFKCKPKHGLIVPSDRILAHSSSGASLESNLRKDVSLVPLQTQISAPPRLRRSQERPVSQDQSLLLDRHSDFRSVHLEAVQIRRRIQQDQVVSLVLGQGSGLAEDAFLSCGMTRTEGAVVPRTRRTESLAARKEKTNSGLFSFLRWFRRENKTDRGDERSSFSNPGSPVLKRSDNGITGSVDTLFSTATAASFAYVKPEAYRPFGDACEPQKWIYPEPETHTYRNRIRKRDELRRLNQNLSLREKYNLYASGSLGRSLDEIFDDGSFERLQPSESCSSTLARKKRKAPAPPPREDSLTSTGCDSLPTTLSKESLDDFKLHRRTVSESAKYRNRKVCHVKGKRKAPAPPTSPSISQERDSIELESTTLRKKRKAPPPPLDCQKANVINIPKENALDIVNDDKLNLQVKNSGITQSTSTTQNSEIESISSTDTLRLEKGILKPNKMDKNFVEPKLAAPTSPVSPRPWYKRPQSSGSSPKQSDWKKKESKSIEEWMFESGFPRRSQGLSSDSKFSIFNKSEKPEDKRRSQISILTNISELDREAAEIIQRGKERERSLLESYNAKYYVDTVEDDDPSFKKDEGSQTDNVPKKPTAKELITLFNSITNVSRVTVNNFIATEEMFTRHATENENSKVKKEIISTDKINGYSKIGSSSVRNDEQIPGPSGIAINGRGNKEKPQSKITSSIDNKLSKVTIEELEEFDSEKSKDKEIKFSNPTPIITEVSESDMKSSSGSTICSSLLNDSSSSLSSGSTSGVKLKSTQLFANYPLKLSFWKCSRCTLDNPRWRLTCEACDMWRPTVCDYNQCKKSLQSETKSDQSIFVNNKNSTKESVTNNKIEESEKVLDKETSNLIRNGQILSNLPKPKGGFDILKLKNSPGAIKRLIHKENQDEKNPNKVSLSNNTKIGDQPTTVIKSENSNDPEVVRKARLAFFEKSETKLNSLDNQDPVAANNLDNISKVTSDKLKLRELLKEMKDSLPKHKKSIPINTSTPSKETTTAKPSANILGPKPMIVKQNSLNETKSSEPVYAAVSKNKNIRQQSLDETERKEIKKIVHTKNQDASSPSCSKKSIHNEIEDNIKDKLITKNFNKPIIVDSVTKILGNSQNEIKIAKDKTIESKADVNKNPAENYKPINVDQIPSTSQTENFKKAEAILVKTETIIDAIKIKKKPEKVSSSAQTSTKVLSFDDSSVLPDNNLTSPDDNNSEFLENNVQLADNNKTKTNNKIIVPVTAEEYLLNMDGTLEETSVRKEPMKIDIKKFEMMRPRDFTKPLQDQQEVSQTDKNNLQNVLPTPTSLSSSTKLNLNVTKEPEAGPSRSTEEVTENNNIGTLALNRLLRRLETAITGGNDAVAALLAKELAKLKVPCTVVRQSSLQPADDDIVMNIMVEDKSSQRGPIIMKVKPWLKLSDIKRNIEQNHHIPYNKQRWFIDKKLASDDEASIKQLGVAGPSTPIFLYLISSENKEIENSRNDKISNQKKILNINPPRSDENLNLIQETNNVAMDEKNIATSANHLGWKCELCGKLNKHENKFCVECPALSPTSSGSSKISEVNKKLTSGDVNLSCSENMKTSIVDKTVDVHKEKAQEIRLKQDIKDPPRDQPSTSSQAVERERRENYQRLVDLEKDELVISVVTFECPVCFIECKYPNGVVLKECLHSFCRGCLSKTIEYSDEAEVKCPFRDDTYTCDSILLEREIKALVSPEVYEEHLAKSIALAETKISNAFHCKTPDCKGWCIFEDNVNLFKCPVCLHSNCLTCQVIHEGLNCKQYQEQLNQDSEVSIEAKRTKEMLKEMVDRGEAMPCPRCKVVLMKKWGCDWLRCSMCKTEICWVTRGPRWGPNGKGDTSGGCQCGVNGIKCHPKCNYCH